MKKKFKADVYRDAIKRLEKSFNLDGYAFACNSLDKVNKEYTERFCLFFTGSTNDSWVFSRPLNSNVDEDEPEYKSNTTLGRRTREIALELAAHLEETGEMDRILKGR